MNSPTTGARGTASTAKAQFCGCLRARYKIPATGSGGVPDGIRTRVLALKGPRPGPLDDGDTCMRSPGGNHSPLVYHPHVLGGMTRPAPLKASRDAAGATTNPAADSRESASRSLDSAAQHLCDRETVHAGRAMRSWSANLAGLLQAEVQRRFARRLIAWSTPSYSCFDARMVTRPAATLPSV